MRAFLNFSSCFHFSPAQHSSAQAFSLSQSRFPSLLFDAMPTVLFGYHIPSPLRNHAIFAHPTHPLLLEIPKLENSKRRNLIQATAWMKTCLPEIQGACKTKAPNAASLNGTTVHGYILRKRERLQKISHAAVTDQTKRCTLSGTSQPKDS